MNYKILAINPGSTSTKIAVYENETKLFSKTINHNTTDIENYNTIGEQFDMRKEEILLALIENNINVYDMSAIVGRGGILPPVKSGAYEINDLMVDRLKNRPLSEHASSLGAIISSEIAKKIGVKSYIYDSVAVDELEDIARISGMPDIERISNSHALNSRAMAINYAEKNGKKYNEMNFIVAHLGGGISLSAHRKGKMIDILSDDEGPFSPERAGKVPCNKLIDLCYSGKFDKGTMKKKLRGNGGLKAYLNTVDAREVEKMIDIGDENAKLLYEAMAYQVAKGIGELSTVLYGDIDAIIITGGIAYSSGFTHWIEERVKFIAPVAIMPGEHELVSLAMGTLRVLRNEEEANIYTE
jgi:butyrate kinase